MKYQVISQNIDILKLLEILNIEGEIQGDNFMARCPVNPDHKDKSPSWGIRIGGDSKGVWNCYGCGMKGNAVHLIQLVKGISRDEAEGLICQWFDIQDLTPEVTSSELLKMLEDPQQVEDEEVLVIPLPKTSENKDLPLKYLMEKRRYTEKEARDIINEYEIKYCEAGYYGGRIIIPIYDSHGEYVTFEAQAVDPDTVEKKKLYPKGSSTSRLMFNDFKVDEKRVCVVEGIWDVIRLRSYGIPSIGVFGASISKYQACHIIGSYDEVTIFFDGDKAGEEATQKARDVLFPYVTVGTLAVEGKDPDGLSRDEVVKLGFFDEQETP